MNELPEEVPGTAYSLLDAALWYAAHGWQVLPCHTPTPDGCSCRNADCDSIGKHPRSQHGRTDATTSASTIRRWWEMWPDANIGIATGAASNLVVLDEDTYKGGDVHTLELAYHPLPETVEQHTGGGGRQFFYTHPGTRIKNSVEDLGTGLDIRGDGGYVIVPPSLHASGRRYQWEVVHDPEETPLAPLPDWLHALCSEARSSTGTPERIDAEALIPEGQRNDHLFRLGCSMRARGFAEAAIFGALAAINAEQCQPPLRTEEVRSIAASCARYDVTAPVNGTMPLPHHAAPQINTPYGDVFYAEWFVALHGSQWRFCHAWDTWLHWVGSHWERDSQKQAMEAARQTMRAVGHHAVETDNKELLKHYSRNLNHAPLVRLLAQASTLPGVAIDPGVLDQHPYLLNCRNGTLDLRTGKLARPEPTQYLTRCLPFDYEEKAQAPRWHKFLWRIMGGTEPLDDPDASSNALEERARVDEQATRYIAFLQRAFGYACTGDTSEECLFLLYGTGRNGKSKLLSTMQRLLGPYSKTANMQSFLHTDRETVRNDLADLNACRLVCASETNESARFAEGLVKQLTGGDRIKARFLFEEYFEYTPEFKLFLAFNYKPDIRGMDDAIWARVKLIPFTVRIPDDEQDKHLSEKLAEELPGILAWCVQGALAWQKDGLNTPPEFTHATQEWREESDYLQRFIAECCYVQPEADVQASTLYAHYKQWCDTTGEVVKSQNRFGRDLTSKGFLKKAGTNNVQWRQGLGLPAPEERSRQN